MIYDKLNYTVLVWEEVINAVAYEVYVNGKLYKTVDTMQCEIANSYLNQHQERIVMVMAVSKQGFKSELSAEYDLAK